MVIKNISDNIGHDGEGFFCRLCGKAGYKSMAAVKGHLAQCPGMAIKKGVIPKSQPPIQLAAASYSPATAALSPASNVSGSYPAQQQPQPQKSTSWNSQPQLASWQAEQQRQAQQLADNTQQIAQLQNERHHLMLQNSLPKESFFERYKGIIITGGIIFVLILLFNQSRQCQVISDSGDPVGRVPAKNGFDINSIGTKALTKLVDTGISKGVSSFFK